MTKRLQHSLLASSMLLICSVIAAGQNAAERKYRPREFSIPDLKRSMPISETVRVKSDSASSSAAGMEMNYVLDTASRSIHAYNPALTAEILAEDQRVVRTAMPMAEERLRKDGFSPIEARDALLFAWILLRIGPNAMNATVAIKVQILDDQLSNMGKLVIISDPDAAQVSITAAGQSYADETEARLWLTATTYRIKISKPGYVTVEDECVVRKGKKTEFKRTLAPAN